MKLFIENNTELIKLAQFFRKIEVIAAKSGIDIDDLIEDQINKNYFFSYPSRIINYHFLKDIK